jgi:hypothetical protein
MARVFHGWAKTCTEVGYAERRALVFRRAGNYHFLNTTYSDLHFADNDQLWSTISLPDVSPVWSLSYGFKNGLPSKDGTYCMLDQQGHIPLIN